MLMITRTESTIELGRGETRPISIDVGRICSAMLAAERAPCGRIFHALLLMIGSGVDPIRIEGSWLELTEVHQYIVETMRSVAKANQAEFSVH